MRPRRTSGGLRKATAGTAAVAALLMAGCSAHPAAVPPAPSTTPSTLATTSATASSAPGGATAPTQPARPRRVTVAMSGDVLIHSGVWESAHADALAEGRKGMDYRRVIAGMRPVYQHVDLAICHLETPLAKPRGPFLSYPIFSAPPQVVPALKWAGIDACTTASNHSVDQSFAGIRRSLADLDAAGIAHAGTATTRRQSRTPLLMDVGGVSVALLSYTFSTNGLPIPSRRPWSVPLINASQILSDAHQARSEGADIVMVALHAGNEYQTAPNDQQLRVYDALTRSPDIDLVYGHHAHVVQPFDVIHGTWVAYGLGNFVAQQLTSQPETYRGVTAEFTFVEQPDGGFQVTRARFVPTMITPYSPTTPMRVLDAPAALADPSTDPALRPQLRDVIAHVRADVFSLGARHDGLRMAH
ncbi:MAG: CapA family protein [Nocardioidaceae bacterium]